MLWSDLGSIFGIQQAVGGRVLETVCFFLLRGSWDANWWYCLLSEGEGCSCIMLAEVETYSRGPQKAAPYAALKGISPAVVLAAALQYFKGFAATRLFKPMLLVSLA